MEEKGKKSIAIPIVVVPIAGVFLLGVCFMLYFGVYRIVESAFYSTNMGGMPAEPLRLSLAAVLILAYFILLRTKAPELVKAIGLTAPLGVLLIAVILGFYQNPLMLGISVVVIAGLCGVWIHKTKKPWIFYYAAAVAIAAALFYALPR